MVLFDVSESANKQHVLLPIYFSLFFSSTYWSHNKRTSPYKIWVCNTSIWTCFCNRWCVSDVSASMCLYFLQAVTNNLLYLTNLTTSNSSITQGICRYSSQNVCYVSESASQSLFTGNVLLLSVLRDASGSGLYMHSEDGKGHWHFTNQNFASKISRDTWRKAINLNQLHMQKVLQRLFSTVM